LWFAHHHCDSLAPSLQKGWSAFEMTKQQSRSLASKRRASLQDGQAAHLKMAANHTEREKKIDYCPALGE